ncbi:hypothetical protein KQH60_07340 [Mycetohabitans sp. B8]|uniref:hypothetical protein n=1 Tax=Mycetohabitans sp. B8 TaxID=2841845 RepID=UPI001F2FCC01|nr:hypothetical protein [Mycetohabitans sp. B8]MCG1042378.1 hypothetical protein [Mycetohabitans sp. B8]
MSVWTTSRRSNVRKRPNMVVLACLRSDLSNESQPRTVTPYLTADILRELFTLGQMTVGTAPLPAALGKVRVRAGDGFGARQIVVAILECEMRACHRWAISPRNVFGQASYRYSG